ncbi:MAG TPA: carbonic anhydrase [candidate division Zixibacteria bacterium]|nr:carbonic anhydrase [candidate division Zixibacteria bacterium]
MQSVKKLGTGFTRFRKKYFGRNRSLFSELVKGQRPKTLVVSCSDSRVDPAIIFDCRPGELFIVRNVANLVPPYNPDGGVHGVSAALEFAIRNLKVENIVVLGHARCGGIQALLGRHSGEFVSHWMATAESAKSTALEISKGKSKSIKQRNCEFEVLKLSYQNLLTFPWIKDKAQKKKLNLLAWYFDLEKGNLLEYSLKTGTFKSII